MPNMNHLIARFDQVPSLVNPEAQGVFEANLRQADTAFARIHADTTPVKMHEEGDFWYSADDWRSSYRPYSVRDGILIVPIKGVLLHDLPFQLGSWATGYPYIQKAFERGMSDPKVLGIAMVVDSPGGEVAGNFDLVDRIFARRGQKPIRAYVNESSYSAAYSLASAADTIVVPKTGGVGSVGVVTSHVDMSAMLEKEGFKITFIHAGKHKVDGNPYEALKPEVKDRIQFRIDELYDVFVATVARNRNLSEDAVRATEALTFTASQAVENGLADTIGSFDEALTAFSGELTQNRKDIKMTISKEDHDKAVASAHAEGFAHGKAEGAKEGATAERGRISAILDSEEAKKRPVAANVVAFDADSNKTAEQATAYLAKLPEEKVEAPVAAPAANGFESRMNATENLSNGTPADGEQVAKPSRAAAALNSTFGAKKPA